MNFCQVGKRIKVKSPKVLTIKNKIRTIILRVQQKDNFFNWKNWTLIRTSVIPPTKESQLQCMTILNLTLIFITNLILRIINLSRLQVYTITSSITIWQAIITTRISTINLKINNRYKIMMVNTISNKRQQQLQDKKDSE